MLLDLRMPHMGGLELLRTLRQEGIDIPTVVLTAHGSIESAVEAMKEGAYDFITKPFDAAHLEIVIRKALEREDLRQGLAFLTEETEKRYQLVVGESAAMKGAVDTARRAAASASTILLLGESGTGKEVFARAIHHWSDRGPHAFVAINCVGLSRELLESELFGHERGAFTGAHELKKGKIELAHGGTVLLDEVGDISPELQTKLLRFLQEREFERVGGLKPIRVDVRIIASTNRNLETLMKEGRFREDLYHRLNVVPIALAALRERRDDIPALTGYFLSRFAAETKRDAMEISRAALDALMNYSWPGNVRELANVIERAVVLGRRRAIDVEDLPPRIQGSEPGARPSGLSYRKAVEAFRKELIRNALTDHHGNRAAAARALGLHEKYFLRVLKVLRIEPR
jgi:DNA-binding NtrC family response regulator